MIASPDCWAYTPEGVKASMYSEPPLKSTSPTLWLPPKVWFHGSQSTMTGGSSFRKVMVSRIIT